MTKTQVNEVTDRGKRVARWLTDRLKSAAPAPTTKEIMTRVHSVAPSPQFSSEDQIGVGRVALAILRRDDEAGWVKFIGQNPDVMDRPGAEQS